MASSFSLGRCEIITVTPELLKHLYIITEITQACKHVKVVLLSHNSHRRPLWCSGVLAAVSHGSGAALTFTELHEQESPILESSHRLGQVVYMSMT